MLKITVPEFKRGDADEVLNSVTNFNTVLRACGLEAVAYMDEAGSAEDEVDLGTLVQRLVAKDAEVVASMRASMRHGVTFCDREVVVDHNQRPRGFQIAHINRMVICHLWGVREKRNSKRAQE